ncbi:MAG: ABC transporter permease [Lewinellaceae bacterium]|nr:ABC transporter permease [Lewinellaceae bacterium]
MDSTFFRLFDYHFLAGDARRALDEPFSVALSEQLARKLFGEEEAVGQTIRIGGGEEEHPYTVTGVFDGSLGKSHLMPEFFMAMNSSGIGQYIRSNNSWAGNNFVYGYLRLRYGTDPLAVEAKIPAFLRKHGASQLRDLGMDKQLHLRPVSVSISPAVGTPICPPTPVLLSSICCCSSPVSYNWWYASIL